MRPTLLALSLVALAAVAPAASAHGAPLPADKVTRLLEDWTDDCGGDGGSATGACRGSEDVVALDIQETYDATLGDAAVFRLYADKGDSGSHKDVLTVKATGGTKTFTWQTGDDTHFANGGGFDRVGNAVALGDGTRFYVEGWVALSNLGAVGDVLGGSLGDIRVDAYAGSSVGDFMPGGCHSALADCVDTGQSAGQRVRLAYTLRGPVQYASLDAPSDVVQVGVGEEQMAQLTLSNLLTDQAQSLMVTVTGADGVTARFHNPADTSGGGYSDVGNVGLAKKGTPGDTTILHLAITGVDEGKSGALLVTLSTDQGGRVQRQVQYQVGASGSATSSSRSSQSSKASPAAFPLVALLAVALAARTRRS